MLNQLFKDHFQQMKINNLQLLYILDTDMDLNINNLYHSNQMEVKLD